MADIGLNIDTSSMVPDVTQESPGGFIDTATFRYLQAMLSVVLNPALSVCAVCTSCVNIATFTRMDLGRGVNLNLLVLSVSDLVLSSITICVNVAYILLWLGYYVIEGVSVLKVLLSFRWFLVYPMHVSLITTTVIAVVRCFYVVMPLSAPAFFTIRRQFVLVVISSGLSLIIPVYYTRLYISVYLSPEGRNISQSSSAAPTNNSLTMFDIFRSLLFFSCLCIILISIAFLTIAVKRSSRFRAKGIQSSAQTANRKLALVREAHVMKTVLQILAVFVTCNIPLMVMSALRQWLTQLTRTGQYRYEKEFIEMIAGTGLILNAGVNTFVYISCNQQFEAKAKALFCPKRDTNAGGGPRR